MRVAVCITSFGRLHELMFQTYAMLDQSYENKHVFVAVKGYTPDFFKTVILPRFQHFIDAGKLTMRLFPNSNQLTNFVDTIRDLDISGYDLFCKIDDDDFYDRDYLKLVVAGLEQYPPETSAAWQSSSVSFAVMQGDTFALKLQPINRVTQFGCTLCLAPKVMRRVIEAEKERNVLQREMVVWKGKGASIDIGSNEEDAWFRFLIKTEGFMPTNDLFTSQRKIAAYVGDINRRHSVWRGSFSKTPFSRRVKSCEKIGAEWVNTPDGIFYIFEGSVQQEGGTKRGKLIKHQDGVLQIQLDGAEQVLTYRQNPETLFYEHE